MIKISYPDLNPPHFHLEYQGYKAFVTIENGMKKTELRRIALNLVYEWLDLHKDE